MIQLKLAYHLSVFFAAIALVQGCVPKPIQMDLVSAESLPVVWSQALPESGAIVYLGKSFSALAYQEGDSTAISEILAQMLIGDGMVSITHNGQADTLFELSPGIYASLTLPMVIGDTYTLNAYDPATGKSISAVTSAYGLVEIDSLTYVRIDSSKARVKVHFEDPVGANYYAFHFYSRYTNPLDVDDPLAADNVVNTKLATDLEFQSQNAVFEVELEELDSDTLYVSLNNISPIYFDYLGQRQRGGNIYNQLVQEPINYVSNIERGYGMFTLHLPSVRMLMMEQ